MSIISLTSEQQLAYDAIGTYKTLFLGGAAGCGKSVVVTEKVKNDTSGTIILCATTNKAASVLTEKLNTGVEVPTLHSVLGLKPMHDGSTKDSDEIVEFIFPTSAKNKVSLAGKNLIIDEASMINLELEMYLLAMIEYGNLSSVTFVGDKYQLPCVKGEFFDYEAIEQVIELSQVLRTEGDLLAYYGAIRQAVIENTEFELYEHAIMCDSEVEFIEQMKKMSGSKIIITYTNEAAKRYSKLIDSAIFYNGQECNALSHCNYKHLDLAKKISIKTNSPVSIVKVFKDYNQMERDALRSYYEYGLPIKPIEIEISNIFYAKVTNELEEVMYISIWDGTQKEKENVYLNKFTREYRKLQDGVKTTVNTQIWNRYAKEDGYLKKLSLLQGVVKLPSHIMQQDRKFWNNFHVITDAVILRSKLVSTAHRAQGITVDVVGIDIDDLSTSEDSKLIYVALTRASKALVFYRNKGNNNDN